MAISEQTQVRSPRQRARLADQIELACLIEATARKPGNVHPGASFPDLDYDDFVAAARISAPILAKADALGVGRCVLEAVQATIAETGTNVNLGICLLIAPLAAVPAAQTLKAGVRPVLQGFTVDDARLVYEAIRLASPGGLGSAPDQDVSEEPTQTLLEVMKLAAERDGIAGEYSTEFRRIYLIAAAWMKLFFQEHHGGSGIPMDALNGIPLTDWEHVAIRTQLSLMAVHGDTLIRRKCGDAIFHEAACRAEYVAKIGPLETTAGRTAWTDLDVWLRADGHRRNPGTTADLIAGTWFIAIRDELVDPPTKDEVFQHAARIRQNGKP